MRTGWNPRLAELLQRPDPVARVIPEAVVTAAEDVRRRQDEWDEVADPSEVVALPSGGIRLAGMLARYMEQTTRDGWMTDFQPDNRFRAARLTWQPHHSLAEVTTIRAWLHPRLDGAKPQEVAFWECRIYALLRVQRFRTRDAGVRGTYLSLAEIGRSRVAAGGGEGEVSFAFDGLRPASYTPIDITDGGSQILAPQSFVVIAALKADGSPAGNVAWGLDSSRTSVIHASGVRLQGCELEDPDKTVAELAGWYLEASTPSHVPYLVVESSSYQEATVTFSGEHQIDLGVEPEPGMAVEFVAQGETPGDTELIFEVLADDGQTWVPVRDGQTADELPGVSARQQYAMRVTLRPSSAGDATPIARDIGARTVRRWPLLGLAEVWMGTSWGFDPLTFRGSIPTATVTLIRDGARDYSDFATELLSQHAPGDIEIRLWVGSERLPRSDWLLLDVFELEDYDPQPAAIHLHCISPAARLRAAQLPPLDEVRKVREPLVYTNQSLAAVYADLLDGQIALPERYRGAGVPDTSTLVSKRITEGDGKTELDAIAYLAGGAVIASQGVVKWIDVAGAAGLRAVFPAEEITVLGASPGLRQATPEWIVPWDWSDEEGRFRGEVPVHHLPALEAVRAGRLDAPQRLEDGIARWIHDEQHARQIGIRHVQWFGAGLIQLHFQTEYAHPHLEPGDLILVELRDFVARDPNTARALKGQLWAIATVNEVADPLGRELFAWVRSYADLIPTSDAYERIGDVAPEVLAIERSVDKDGRVSLVVYGNTMAGYIRAAATTGPAFPDDQVDAAPAVPGRVAAFNDLIQIGPADVARISVRAYERSDGQGAASEIVHAIAVHPRIGTPAVQARVSVAATGDTADVYATVDSPIGEALRLHVRDSDAQGAPTWSLVQGNGNQTPLYVADGTELGPTAWFHDGSTYAQKLKEIALSRDQIRRLYVQAEGEQSGLTSTWIPIPLELKAQPWLESVAGGWNQAGTAIEVTAIGGAHCQSARYELSKDNWQTVAAQRDVALVDGQRLTESFLIDPADRQVPWRVRVIPHNAALSGGQVSGLAGAPQEASVAAQPAPPPVQALPPVARIEYIQDDGTFYQLRLTGQLGAGAVGSLEYRRRTVIGGVPGSWGPGAGDGWASLPGGGATYTAARQPRDEVVVELEVRDADGRVGTDRYTIGPGLPGIGSGGRALWSEVEDDDGGRAQTIDGATRARTGLTAGGRLKSGVEPTADIDGRPASELRGQVESASQNLLVGTAWEGPVTVGPNATRYPGMPGASAAQATYPLALFGWKPGGRASYSADGRAKQAGGIARIGLIWVDSNGAQIRSDFVETTSTTFERLKVAGVQIPATAVGVRPYYGERSGNAEAEFDLPVLNTGPICLDPVAPGFRPHRETADHIRPGDRKATIEKSYVDEQGRPIKLRRSSGDVTADQFVAEGESIIRLSGRNLDNISDTATYRRTTRDEADGGGRAFQVIDQNLRVQSQVHLPMIAVGSLGSIQIPTFVWQSVLTAEDMGSAVRISVSSHTLRIGGQTIPYFGVLGAATGLAYETRYYVYTDDPHYEGGTRVYVATTNPADLFDAVGRYYVGTIVTPKQGNPSTGGGGGGGGGILPPPITP